MGTWLIIGCLTNHHAKFHLSFAILFIALLNLASALPIWAMVGFLHRVVCNTHLINPLGIHLLTSHMTMNIGGTLMHCEMMLHPLPKKLIFFIHAIDLLSMKNPNAW